MEKEKLKEIVKEYIKSIPFNVGEFGIAQHPIFNIPATIDETSGKLLKVDEDNFERLLEQRLDKIDRTIDQCNENLSSLFFQIHKPFHIPLFIKISTELDKKQFSNLLIDLWTETEFPHENGVDIMIALFNISDNKYMMNDKERKAFSKLKDKVTVYRGLQKNAVEKGLSWTLDKNTAIWFAKRFDRNGKVLKAEIDKKYIFALKLERQESEVILNPNFLKNKSGGFSPPRK